MKKCRKYFADVLSLLRALATIPLVLLSLYGEWRVAHTVLLAAWATDLLDGLAARHFGSLRERWPKSDIDGYADIALGFVSSLIFAIYAWFHYFGGWIIAVAWVAAVISGAIMVHLVKERPGETLAAVTLHMVMFHAAFQIILTISWFAYMAFGLPVAGITMAALIFGTIHHQKFKLWWKGRLS